MATSAIVHVCDLSGQRRADAPDYQVLLVCDKILPYSGRPWRPLHRKLVSATVVRAPRNQTLSSIQSSVTANANHTGYPTHTQRPVGSSSGGRQGLHHAVGCLLQGFFGFMRAGEFAVAQVSEFNPAASLCQGDIAVDSHQNPTVVQVRLKQSKTDPFRRGSPSSWAEHGQICAQ